MAEEILDGINPTRMELLALKKREALAVKGHGLLKQKRDALIKEFFDILDRVEGARENAEKNLFNAYEALTEAHRYFFKKYYGSFRTYNQYGNGIKKSG